jgi:hypothetical protein
MKYSALLTEDDIEHHDDDHQEVRGVYQPPRADIQIHHVPHTAPLCLWYYGMRGVCVYVIE